MCGETCDSIDVPLGNEMDQARQRLEVDRSYDAFVHILGKILDDHRDQLALMRDGGVVGYFDTPRQALEAAARSFPDGIFSIQEVTDEALDLGFWSHVAPH